MNTTDTAIYESGRRRGLAECPCGQNPGAADLLERETPTAEYLLGMIEGMRTVWAVQDRARGQAPSSDSPAGRAYRLGRHHGSLTTLGAVLGLWLTALLLGRRG